MSNDHNATVRQEGPQQATSRKSLLVIRNDAFETHALPNSGSVTLGRDSSCDIVIDDPSLSRTHARIVLGKIMVVEDLASSNGTTLRQTRLEPNVLTVLSINETMELGSATVIVQSLPARARASRILDHDQFELSLQEACKATRDELAVVHLSAEETLSPSVVAEAFAAFSTAGDVLATYSPNAIEILLVETATRNPQRMISKFQAALALQGIRTQAGIALYPSNGRNHQKLIQHALMEATANSDLGSQEGDGPIIESQAMKHLWGLAKRVAQGDISVLILGETGVGKEVLAEYLHNSSKRAAGPFIRLNCGALSPTLLESELFGYEKGAFTGADKAKAGLLEAASGGTLFLDELGEAPKEVQVRLLRVLEESKVLRVGGLEPRDIDVRVLGATNLDLEDQIEDGKFRRDLYYRIAGVTLAIPPLRERTEDIMPLAHSIVRAAAQRMDLPTPRIAAEAQRVLLQYSWPGNIRELRNMLERAVLLQIGSEIGLAELPMQKMQSTYSIESTQESAPSDAPIGDEHARIVSTLRECGGNQTQAAKVLGIDRKTLSKRMSQYGLARPRKG